jgi:glycosyltransferase involved in cell wall biosynthesis
MAPSAPLAAPLQTQPMTLPVIALLGKKDQPTDAVEEYCRYLAAALQPHDIQMEIRRVPWEIHGSHESLNALKLMATQWRNTWVLVQYTALAWSARGFPLKLLRAMKILKSAGARIGIIYHDAEPYAGTRLLDSFRRFIQAHTMRRALAQADLAIFTVPPEQLSWPPAKLPQQSAFIPVGANLPIPTEPIAPIRRESSVPTIGVFSITGGDPGTRETELILSTVRHAALKLGRLHLSVFGRHAELREAALREGLRDSPVDLTVEGIVDPAQVVQNLCACNVLLFVRGPVSSRRSSAIAAISCSLPVVAFSGSETAAPITDAGVLLIPPDQPAQLSGALVQVLSDPSLQAQLSTRSRNAHRDHFSWPAIATKLANLLQP